MKFLIMQSSPACHHILLGSNILLNTQFSHTLRDQVSHPLKQIKWWFCILQVFRVETGTQKILNLMIAKIPRISSWMRFWFVTVVPKYWNLVTF